jgi:hypothetical protein
LWVVVDHRFSLQVNPVHQQVIGEKTITSSYSKKGLPISLTTYALLQESKRRKWYLIVLGFSEENGRNSSDHHIILISLGGIVCYDTGEGCSCLGCRENGVFVRCCCCAVLSVVMGRGVLWDVVVSRSDLARRCGLLLIVVVPGCCLIV